MLNELVSRCFPETFMKFCEQVLNHEEDRRTDLFIQILGQTSSVEYSEDQLKVIERVRFKIARDVDVRGEQQLAQGLVF